MSGFELFLPSSLPATELLARTKHVGAVLRVSLNFSPGDTEIQFDLSQRAGVAQHEHRVWKYPLAAVGAPSSLLQPLQDFTLPPKIAMCLRDALTAQSLPADQPLWLDLLRPYGLLGALPWESALGEDLRRPILRLPTFLERPHEDQDIADVAILVTADPNVHQDRTVWQVRTVVEAILTGSKRLQTRVHIFAPEPWHELLTRLPSEQLDERPTQLYKPPPIKRGPADLRRLWTKWMSESLGGQTLDAVHVICDVEPTMTNSMLVLRQPWQTQGRQVVTWLSVEDLCAMLTLLGAWAVTITPRTHLHCMNAAAFFADTAAHTRPGPLLYHPLEVQDDANALADGYRFLLSPEPTQPPILLRGFLYGLPSAVANAATKATDESEANNSAVLTKGNSVSPPQQVPNWASATQRFFETAMLDELRRASDDVLLSKSNEIGKTVNSASPEAVRQTLSDIKDVVSRHLSLGTSATAGGARSRVRTSISPSQFVRPHEAIVEIGASDKGRLSVRLLKGVAGHDDSRRHKSMFLDCTKLPKLDTLPNVTSYATQIRDALCRHRAVAAELKRIAGSTPAALRFVVDVPEAETPRWEAVSMPPFLALKPDCTVTRIAHKSDIRDPGVRTFSWPIRMIAFLSAADASAEEELKAIHSAVLLARQQGLQLICSVYLGEQELIDKASKYPGVNITFVPPSALEVGQVIKDQSPQIVHFFCHGLNEAGERLLELATICDWDTQKKIGSVRMSIERLRQVLISTGTTWLTVLNTCSGATPAGSLPSMASELAQSASPVTIGMAEPIKADAATVFTRAFYGRVFEKLSESLAGADWGDAAVLDLGLAVNAAREKLHEEYQDTPKDAYGTWCLPVLYERDTPLRVLMLPEDMKTRIELIAGALRSLPASTPLLVRKEILGTLANPPPVPEKLRPDAFGNLV